MAPRLMASMLALALVAAGPAAEGDRAAMQAELDGIADRVLLPRAFNLIHELVGPSVVAIHTRQRLQYRRLGQLTVETREIEVGEGSGFVVHSDENATWILTNAHVVLRTDHKQEFIRDRGSDQPLWYDRIQVATRDLRSADAVPVGADLKTDLALLRIDGLRLPPVRWADSDQVRVGDWVLALGYPLGVGYSASSGIISATARSTGVYASESGYEAFLQTDAAINPGNSGGPLVDLHGRVLGVNSNIVSRGGGNVGIGFAIPANLALRVADDLRDDGRVSRPMVGIQMDELASGEAERLGIANRRGVRVTLVFPGSPAEAAGLRDGDVIVAVDGVDLLGIQHFRSRVASIRLGTTSRFRVWRDGELVDLDVRPVGQEDLARSLEALSGHAGAGAVQLPAFGLVLGGDGMRGAVVRGIEAGSPAERSGLAVGDRILRVADFGLVGDIAALAALDERAQLVLDVLRGNRLYLVRLVR